MNDHLETTGQALETTKPAGPVIVPFSSPVRGPEAFRSARAARERVQAGLSASAAALAAVSLPAQPHADVTPIGVSKPVAIAKPAEAERSTSEVLGDTIRRWARPTTIEELKNRGVQNLRSISMSRVGALLEKAVNRALIERTLESDTDEALTLSTTAREQFVRLTQAEVTGSQPTDLLPHLVEEKPLHERATSTLDRLRRELDDRRRVLADREKQLSDGDLDQAEDSKLGNMMRELFAEHAGVDDRLLEREVLDLVLGELRTSRRRARMARLEEHQREIGTLERRITKLSALLGETEDALRRIRAGKRVDPGVSSIYDEVQGLGPEDEQFEQKSELMRSLFEANLALRK
ncbi:hypothetical protein [Planctomycetes bacterium Poly30]|uniref:hypothetical protein n=1 Tax=Saltatorellus ferox TaxID=2528018 RepID=UPI0011A9405E